MKSNLLIYIEFTSFGGSEQYVCYLIEALHLNYNIFLACTGSESYAEYFKNNKKLTNVFYNAIQFQPVNNDNYAIHHLEEFSIWIGSIIDEISPNMFIANNGGYPWNMSCIIALELSNKKGVNNCILIPHSTPDDVYHFNGRSIDKVVSESVSAIIFGSKKLMKLYQLRRNLAPNLFKVCRYGVPDFGIKKSRNRTTGQTIIVGFMGSMRNLRKGQMQILKAASITKSDNITYLFAGSGEKIHELQSFRHKNNLENVKFLGHLNGHDKCKFFSEVDIFILVSEQEGLSLALLEALGSGCSIIATNVGGISEAVYNGVNGFLLNEVSGEILADYIKKLQKSPLLLKEYSDYSRKIYEEKFNYQQFKNKLKKTIADLDAKPMTEQSFSLPFLPLKKNMHSLKDNKKPLCFKKGPLPILIGKILEIEISSKCCIEFKTV